MEKNNVVFVLAMAVLVVMLAIVAYCQYKKQGEKYFIGWKEAVPVFLCGIVTWGFIAAYFDEICVFMNSAVKCIR